MKKAEALQLLGGSVVSAARKIGCSPQAVSNWPEVLSQRLKDRVEAVLWRDHLAEMRAKLVRHTGVLTMSPEPERPAPAPRKRKEPESEGNPNVPSGV